MALTSFVPAEPLESYQERFREHAVFSRDDKGVLEIRFHTRGEVATWSMQLHRALPQIFSAVGQDPENECVILSGTGDHWLKGHDLESFAEAESDPDHFRDTNYDTWYLDGTRLQQALLYDIDVPIISVINGPGYHTEFGLMCDLTIASDDVRFWDPHYYIGLVPGDGQFMVFQELLGLKRAAYTMYVREEGIGAEEALELGLVNELHPRENLLPRAHELADQIMSQHRIVRRLTTSLARRPWKRLFTDDFHAHFASELYAVQISRVHHDAEIEKNHF